MKCFYHNDSDGKCAGYWVKKYADKSYLADKKGGASAEEFIPMDYRKPFPIETIQPGEKIYIVDYSIEPREMDELLKITSDVIWIDHHRTAIEKYANYPHEIKGIRVDGVAACMLAYYYLFKMINKNDSEIKPFDLAVTKNAPEFTKYIADWDVWAFEYGDDTKYFQTAFNAYDFSPQSDEWEWLHFGGYDKLINEGKTMTKYRDGWAKSYCEAKGFETDFEGYKCFAVNLGLCNSEYFNSIDKSRYDILLPFTYNGENWSYSLYSTTVDVSEIAKKYGGGGHKGASGFTCDKLLLRKN